MMVITVYGLGYDLEFLEIAQKCLPIFNRFGIPVNAVFEKGNMTYLRVNQNSNIFGFTSKECAVISGLPDNDWVNTNELKAALEESMGMEVNFV